MTTSMQKAFGAFILTALSFTSVETVAAPVPAERPAVASKAEDVRYRRHRDRDEWSAWERRKHWRRHHDRRRHWDDGYGYREHRHHRHHRHHRDRWSFGFYLD